MSKDLEKIYEDLGILEEIKIRRKEVEEEFWKIKMPKLYDQSSVEDPIVYAKLDGIVIPWHWYIYEADKEERLLFGLVDGDFRELGYVNFDEIKEIGVIIDKEFTPIKLSEVEKNLE